MSAEHRIGEQVVRFEEPDLIFLRLVGSVSDEEGRELDLRQRELAGRLARVFFLIDLERLDKLTPGVRKASTETLRELPTRGIAFCRAPFKARVLAKMIITALNMFRAEGDKHAVEFAETEDEARAWIDARRRQLEAAA